MWALALIENGRVDEARELALAEDLPSVPWDLMWSVTMFLWADACSRLGLLDRAAELYELLAPFSDQLAVSGSMVSGSIPSQLGNLATTLGRYEEAEAHFAAAQPSRSASARRCCWPAPTSAGPARSSHAAGPRTSTAQSTCSSRPRSPPSVSAEGSSLGKSRSAAPRSQQPTRSQH